MKRLTKRLGNGEAILDCDTCELRQSYECGEILCRDRLRNRVAAYEDTALEPEEVATVKLALMGKSIAAVEAFNGTPISRLIELAEADKDGRVVTLPCKVGDTVYQLRKKTHARGIGISPRRVSSACVWADGSYALTHQGMSYCQSGDLGKTWFLTREEAERALHGMEGNT